MAEPITNPINPIESADISWIDRTLTNCPFFQLINRIVTFVGELFESFIDLFRSSQDLSQRQIAEYRNIIFEHKQARKAIKNIKQHFNPAAQANAKKDIDSLDLANSSKKSPDDIPDIDKPLRRQRNLDALIDSNLPLSNSAPLESSDLHEISLRLDSGAKIELPPHIQDESMQELWKESQTVAKMTAEIIYEDKLDSFVNAVKNNISQAPEVIKSIAKMGTSVGFTAFQPLYEKFAKVKIVEVLNPEMRQTLIWLKKSMPTTFLEELTKQIQHNESSATYQEVLTFTKPFAAWLSTNLKAPLSKHYPSELNVTDEQINKVFQAAVDLLLSYKIDLFMKLVNTRLGEQLPKIVQAMITDNSQNISSNLVIRSIDILETMSLPSLVDGLTKATYDQTKAMIALDKRRKLAADYAEGQIINSQNAVQAEPTKQNEASRETAYGILNTVFELGKASYIEKKLYELTNEDAMEAATLEAQDLIQKHKNLKDADSLDIQETITNLGKNKYLQKLEAQNSEITTSIEELGKNVYIESVVKSAPTPEKQSEAKESAKTKIASMRRSIHNQLYVQIRELGENEFIKNKLNENPDLLNDINSLGEKAFISKHVEKLTGKEAQKACKSKAKAEIESHINNKKPNQASIAFQANLRKLGKEAYIQKEVAKAEKTEYFSDPNCLEAIKTAYPVIDADANSRGKTKFHNDFTENLIRTFLPQQKVFSLELSYNATMALNIKTLAPSFLNITNLICKAKANSADNSMVIDEAKLNLKNTLYNLCKDIRQITDLPDTANLKTPRDKFNSIITPMIDNIIELLIRENNSRFNDGQNVAKLNLQDVIDVMNKHLIPENKDASEQEIKKQLKMQRTESILVDPITMMVNDIIIHPAIKKLIEETSIFATELISENAQDSIKDLWMMGVKLFAPKIEDQATNFVKNQIQDILANIIKENIEKYTRIDKLKSEISFNILPSIKINLLQAFARSLISDNINDIAGFFRNLSLKEKEMKSKDYDAIADHLYYLTKQASQLSREDLENLSKEEYRKCIRPMLNFLDRTVRTAISTPIPKQEEVKAALLAALSPDLKGKIDLRLGTLIYNTITELGNFSNIANIASIAKTISLGFFDLRYDMIESLSEMASQSLHDFQDSPYMLVDTVVDTLKKTCPDKKTTAKLILEKNEAPPKTQKEIESSAKAEIEKISRLGYDFLMNSINQKKYSDTGWINDAKKAGFNKAVTLLLGYDASILEKSISDVFQRLFYVQQYANENFVMRCQDVVEKNITQAANELNRNAQPITRVSVPRLIPSFA